MLLHPGSDEMGNGRVAGVADGGDDAHRLQLVLVFDSARFDHGRGTVCPVNFRLFEGVDHIEIDEVDAQGGFLDVVLSQLFHDRVGELLHLLPRSAPHRSLDPGVGVAHVVARYPRAVTIDLDADVTLLEKNRLGALAKQRVAKTGLQPAPAGRDGAGDVAHIFIVHRQYARPSPLRFIASRARFKRYFLQPLPVDALLPVGADQTETRCAAGYHRGLLSSGFLILRTLLLIPTLKLFERLLSISPSSRSEP